MADQLTERSSMRINADLYRQHLADLDKHIRGKDSNVAKMRSVRKEMKQDGVNMQAFNIVRVLAKFDDPDRLEILDAARRLASYEGLTMPTSWRAGNNEDPQGGMFEDEGTPESRKAFHDNRIAMDAWNSRRAGGPAENNPHGAGSEDHQTWAHSWNKADREFSKTIPISKKTAPVEAPPPGDDDGERGAPPAGEVKAAKRGRGRPPGPAKAGKKSGGPKKALAALASGASRVN